MTLPNLPDVPHNPTLEQLTQIVAEMSQQLTYLLSGFLSSDNAKQFGGWQVGQTELQSKDKTVGMSTNKTGVDPIRFFAGDLITGSPAFKVTESGKLYATNGEFTGTITGSTITGGTIRTSASGARIELSGDSLKTYNSGNNLNGFAWGNAVTGATFGDTFLYHNGSKIAQFIDEITNYRISGVGAGWLTLGSASTSVFTSGTWNFGGSANFGGSTVTGLSTDTSGFHDHGISAGVTLATTSDGSTVSGYVTWVPSGSHSHNVS